MKELLELLEKDHTLTPEQLAVMLGMSKDKVTAEIERLEREKVIVKYHTIINWEKAGVDSVYAIIHVNIAPQREVGFDAIAERIYRFPEVKNLYLMSGAFDLSVMVECNSLKEVSQFVFSKLATIEGVVSTTTHFLLKRYKTEGVIMEDEEEDRRLAVTP
ncbi:AsnC family transcriptional regulator [Anaerosporomusa subterranea]|uniref:AsnC family transcriptional regulator n=1 Tax=Anaerosporomusa subterranea TaxID=1794912 RepID=A0A154BMH4_ANASB|nr:Lrp/AsnC family transcriptional regulator [Anaerosporomusa subterranea]KYZ75187.1 AsnC family transcriptional regulator [Anaerosporomusa subterranea]